MALLSLVKLYEVAHYGKLIGAFRVRQPFNQELFDDHVALHRNAAKEILTLTIITILCVEVLGRFVLHVLRYPPLFWIHIIFFAVPFFVLLLLIMIKGFKLNGLQNRSAHKGLVPWCLITGVGANILGAVLVFMIP